MPDLLIHARPIKTFFDLLGHQENDMTTALGWALSRHPGFLRAFLAALAPGFLVPDSLIVSLQEHGSDDGGYTDVELQSPDIHIIVEAKRGWNLPTPAQLSRYESRFRASGAAIARFVVLTQNGASLVVRRRLNWSPPEPVEVCVIGWSDVVRLARAAARHGSPMDRALADQLATYIYGVADMRDTNSNKVWVVPLALGSWDGWPSDLTPIAEVEQHLLYHYPTEGSYPKVVPNYIGFRYNSCLQSIHHVDSYQIIDTPFGHVPGAPNLAWDAPAFLLHLGPPIKPAHRVPTGGVFGPGRNIADLDLLLTCATVKEAVDRTRERAGQG